MQIILFVHIEVEEAHLIVIQSDCFTSQAVFLELSSRVNINSLICLPLFSAVRQCLGRR